MSFMCYYKYIINISFIIIVYIYVIVEIITNA